MFYGARYYDPQLGRFITADTIVQDPSGNPQTFNRYSYTGNNPTSAIDPTGHFFGFIFAAVKAIISKVVSLVVPYLVGKPIVEGIVNNNWAQVGQGLLNIAGLLSGNPYFITAAGLNIVGQNIAIHGGSEKVAQGFYYASAAVALVGTGVEIKNALAQNAAKSGTLTDPSTAQGGNFNSRIEDLVWQIADDPNIQFGDYILQANAASSSFDFASMVQVTVHWSESSGSAALNTFIASSASAPRSGALQLAIDNAESLIPIGAARNVARTSVNVAKGLLKRPQVIRQTAKNILDASKRLYRVGGPAPDVTKLGPESQKLKAIMDFLGQIGEYTNDLFK